MGKDEPTSVRTAGPLVLTSRQDVERLRARPRRLWTASDGISITAPLPAASRLKAEARLNALREVCGCTEGSLAGGTAAILAAASWMWLGVAPGIQGLALTLAAIVAVSIAAKFLRLAVARRQARRELGTLLAEIDATSSTPHVP